jgi:hypothetical protein
MTVVLEPSSGTTTVVVCDGAGGLLLLMQPDRTGIKTKKLARTFIIASLSNRIANAHCLGNPVVNAVAARGFPNDLVLLTPVGRARVIAAMLKIGRLMAHHEFDHA